MSEYTASQAPSLFGIKKSNRDFSDAGSWGKNIFNSSFPTALCCYLSSENLNANYLQFSSGKFGIHEISIDELFGTIPISDQTYFSFETPFSQYDQYIIGRNPRTDLVVSTLGSDPKQTAALEIKMTAIPDSTTWTGSDSEYSAEIVVRTDTIFYLVAGLAHYNQTLLIKHFTNSLWGISDRSKPEEALSRFSGIHSVLDGFLKDPDLRQHPNIIQPVWKTNGKSAQLAEHCLDVFAWSTAGFLHFLLEITPADGGKKVTRTMRTLIWIYSMILDIAMNGQTDFEATIDILSYNTKNDKAFAASGALTKSFMEHSNLTTPRITKGAIKKIILGGGQDFLSPERRFDAVIVNSPELFDR